jgi:ATP synthase protein I
VLLVQLGLTLVAGAGALPFGAMAALSALIGGGVCLAANALVALWIFQRYRAQQAELLLVRFYWAEVAKIALVLGLFAVFFVTIERLSLPALLGAYLAVQVLPAVIAPALGARSRPER